MLPLLALLACSAAGETPPARTLEEPAAIDVFTEWLDAPIPVADGFSLPVSGWEDCGDGCWTNRKAGAVRAIAAGIVRSVDGTTLTTEHLWYDDQQKRTATFVWTGVTPKVTVGTVLTRGQAIGTATTVSIAAEGLGPIDDFLVGRPRLPTPQRERVLALVSHAQKQLRLYVGGAVVGTYEVGFGQAEGDKEVRGDNKTPMGVYHVVYKTRGPFDGDYGAYYGGHWIKLGYPNPWDAARGVDAGLFDAEVQRSITRAFWRRTTPLQGTRLGGGIGLHGWAYEWENMGPRGLSWGCVVLHLKDVAKIYDTLEEGAMVALF